MVAPESNAAEANHFLGGLFEEFPSAEAPLRIQRHLAVYEGLDLLIGPWDAAGDIAHHFYVGRDRPQSRRIGALPGVKDEPLGLKHHRNICPAKRCTRGFGAYARRS